jgi:mitochondrial enoyl-[acyl-carrier protein] reductase / trans-2-enoyl-CoA reductase
MSTRAVVYENNGDPASVLYVVTLPPQPLGRRSVSVKVLLSPINPSDVHVVQGTYAVQPAPRELKVNDQEKRLYLPGNEGLGEIAEVGPDVKSLKRGDWVVFGKAQSGTWSSSQTLEEEEVIKMDQGLGISAVNAATLAVSFSIQDLTGKSWQTNLVWCYRSTL